MRQKTRQRLHFRSLALYLTILALISMMPGVSFAQSDLQDVVYLKNGGVVRGILIEQVPGISIKIQTVDGSVFVYQMSEIEKITKEPPPASGQDTVQGSTWNAPMANTGVLVNLLGIVQFGPIIEGEFKIAPNMVLGPHLRLSGLGLLYHLTVAAADWDEVDEVSMSSMALGATYKYFVYSPRSPHRFYIGGTFEYGWGSSKANVGYSDEWEAEHAYWAVLTNFGYRWRYQSGMFLNVGALAGFGGSTKDEWHYTDADFYDTKIREGEGGTGILGMLELSFGKEF